MKARLIFITIFVLGLLIRVNAQRQMEYLGRGVVAIHAGGDSVFVSWRILGTDPDDIAFNLYRVYGNGTPEKVNKDLIEGGSNYIDRKVNFLQSVSYFVRPILNGAEQEASKAFCIQANKPAAPYLSIPLTTPAGYQPNDAEVGDLDGDGEYEIVVKEEMKGIDNSRPGVCPGTTKLAAYKLDGTFLWRIDLGPNIREGAHYTPFLVYDFDGDGKAEVVVRTAEETVDGVGHKIGDINKDGRTNYVNYSTGYILEGPEFLSVFDGLSGKEIARTDYIPRGNVSDWGDSKGNRVDRFLMGVAYLDGKRPSIIICRGYYALTKLAAWNWRDGKLSNVWRFSSNGNRDYEGQGNHNLSIGDVNDDGRDEIVYGAMMFNSDGTVAYSTRLRHGDAMHLSDIDPDHPGLEVWDGHENPSDIAGAEMREASTGKLLWGIPSSGDVGRALVADIDPRYKGYEAWVAGGGISGLYSCKGQKICERTPACNMAIWWDGDLLREILNGVNVYKWDYINSNSVRILSGGDFNCVSNNGTKSNPCFCGDILGDWREEVIARTLDGKELRIFSTTIPTKYKFYTLMHDPIYRNSAAMQNIGYNQPTQPGFYLGEGMNKPPRPNIVTIKSK